MKVSQDVLRALGAAQISGNELRLSGALDRQTYLAVAKAIEAAGGRWVRKAQAHQFDGPAADAIEPILLTGEVVLAKQEFGAFYTPPDLAAEVVRRAGIGPGMFVLEPSAGHGAIAIAAHAGCPVRQGKVKVRADECPKCGATTSDACGPVARCEYALSEDVRAALNPTGVGEAG